MGTLESADVTFWDIHCSSGQVFVQISGGNLISGIGFKSDTPHYIVVFEPPFEVGRSETGYLATELILLMLSSEIFGDLGVLTMAVKSGL